VTHYPNIGDRVIAANIDFKYQKGQRHKDMQKTITLRLLPATLAMHDSLRLLVTLALVDGVFGPNATWMSFLAIDPGEFQFTFLGKDGKKNLRHGFLLSWVLESRTSFVRDPSIRCLQRGASFPNSLQTTSPQYTPGRRYSRARSSDRV
jgi:hypothetical protein